MSTILPNRVPFLRVQRLFPQEAQPLSVEVDRSYTDIASTVNLRTIGIFNSTNASQNGENWYIDGLRYQGLRQFYSFTSPGSFPHGINLSNIFAFTKIYGTATDGTNWFPLPDVDTTSTALQISLTVTPTDIVITAGGSTPAITGIFVVLEWLSNA